MSAGQHRSGTGAALREQTRARRGISTTKAGTLLKRQIAIRTFADWTDARPAFLEMDLVAHCGWSGAGPFLYTLSMVDVATGWVVCAGLRDKRQETVFHALQRLQAELPFRVLGLDSDKGTEFINHVLLDHCTDHGITFTRSRPYLKNDTCHVEQIPLSSGQRSAARPACLPLVPDTPDQVAFERTACLTWRTTLSLATSHVRLCRCVGALLSQGDEVQPHVEAPIPSAAESVLHRARTGGLDGGHASEYGDLWHTEARPRQAEFGDQPASDDRLYAGDLQQRKEVLMNGGLDVGAELAFLIHEQRDMLGDLTHGLLSDSIQLAGPGRNARTRGLDANSTPQRTNDVLVFRIAE